MMAKTNAIKLFEDKLVRSVWDDEKEEWFFSVHDVVQILTDSANVTDCIKKMRKRDAGLSEGWGQIITPLSVQTAGGLQKTNFADTKGIFRIIQSIPSKKAEPFKLWLAQVGAERLEQLQDPERSIQQAWAGKTAKEYKQFKGLKKENLRDNMTNKRQKGGSLPLAPNLRFSATPSAGDTPATPPSSHTDSGNLTISHCELSDFALAKSNPRGNIERRN